MRHLLKYTFFVLCATLGAFASADLQQDLQSAIDEARPFIAFGTYRIETPIVLKPKAGDDNFSLTIIGSGHPQQWDYFGEGFPFTLDSPKGVTIIGFSGWSHIGDGWRIVSSGSAGRMEVINSRVQCKGTAWLFEAIRQPDGSDPDISVVKMDNCNVQGCKTGLKVTGPNALNFQLDNFTGDTGETFVDFSQGGCDSVSRGGGPSYFVTGYKVNPGYQFNATGIVAEATNTLVDIGSGTGSSATIGVMDARNCQTLVRSATNGGRIDVSAAKCKGSRVILTGDAKTGLLRLDGAAALLPVTGAAGYGKIERTGLTATVAR